MTSYVFKGKEEKVKRGWSNDKLRRQCEERWEYSIVQNEFKTCCSRSTYFSSG